MSDTRRATQYLRWPSSSEGNNGVNSAIHVTILQQSGVSGQICPSPAQKYHAITMVKHRGILGIYEVILFTIKLSV